MRPEAEAAAALAPSHRQVDLQTWLGTLAEPDPAHLLLGGTGHVLLSSSERANTRQHLEQRVLPTLLSRPGIRRVSVITGLAPGADLLFKTLAADWLAQHGIEVDTVALLPVPIPALIRDWVQKSQAASAHVDAESSSEMRARLEAVLADCDTIVDLLPPGTAAEALISDRFRQRQYQRLAACLAEQSDVLIAVLREQNLQQPGGTAEVVEWRRNAMRIPRELSTVSLRMPPAGARRLVIIDPSVAIVFDPPPATLPIFRAQPAQTASARDDELTRWLDASRRSLHEGNYLLAYDQASSAIAKGHVDRRLDYIALLALANAGSTQLALKRLRRMGAVEQDMAEDWLALEGRLLKDLAVARLHDPDPATRAETQRLLRQAADAYFAAFQRTGGYFTAINAATLLLLAGDTAQALSLAREVLQLVSRFVPADETDAYYLRVTEAEAALLLGDRVRCEASLRLASELLRGNLNVRSRTTAQLRLICRHHGFDETLLAAITVAPVLVVHGADGDGTDGDAGRPLPATASFVYAGLSRPADLPHIEHFLGLGGRLHLVLPAARQPLLDRWQRQHGAGWAMRLSRCLDAAAELSIAYGFLDAEEVWCADYVAAMAHGLSRLAAARLGAHWQAVAALPVPIDPVAAQPPSTTQFSRRCIGTLFADFSGYSRLDDAELPLFQTEVLGGIARLLAQRGPQVLLQHTRGDALHVVTVDAASTADIAAEIQALVERLRPTLGGRLAQLELRLAAHYAPSYVGVDPLEGTPTYFGSQLSFAARIEPVTPPGMIFVTESFAARLALEAPERFTVEYAGEVDLAKRFGKYRLFSMRRLRG